MSKRLLQKVAGKGFCLRQCPATCGIPTRTTAAGWARTCHATYIDETGPLALWRPEVGEIILRTVRHGYHPARGGNRYTCGNAATWAQDRGGPTCSP